MTIDRFNKPKSTDAKSVADKITNDKASDYLVPEEKPAPVAHTYRPGYGGGYGSGYGRSEYPSYSGYDRTGRSTVPNDDFYDDDLDFGTGPVRKTGASGLPLNDGWPKGSRQGYPGTGAAKQPPRSIYDESYASTGASPRSNASSHRVKSPADFTYEVTSRTLSQLREAPGLTEKGAFYKEADWNLLVGTLTSHMLDLIENAGLVVKTGESTAELKHFMSRFLMTRTRHWGDDYAMRPVEVLFRRGSDDPRNTLVDPDLTEPDAINEPAAAAPAPEVRSAGQDLQVVSKAERS